MTRARSVVLPALLLALLPIAPAAAGDRVHGDPVLLALGDSVAAGVGAVPPAPGYVELVGDALSDGYNPRAGKATPNASTEFDVVNLAVSGATTADLGPQLLQAAELIRDRQADRDPKNDVGVITLTIGGNDLFGPVVGACLSATPPGTCHAVTSRALAQAGDGVEEALAQLTAAAGKHTEVVVTTYYNSLVAPCRLVPTAARELAEQLAEVVLVGGTVDGVLTVPSGLNEVIEQAAARTGAEVADVYGDVGEDELVGDCLHPNADGHAAIAEEVVATLVR